MPRRWAGSPPAGLGVSCGSPVAAALCDLKACGKESDRLGFDGSIPFAEGGISDKTGCPRVESLGMGTAPHG